MHVPENEYYIYIDFSILLKKKGRKEGPWGKLVFYKSGQAHCYSYSIIIQHNKMKIMISNILLTIFVPLNCIIVSKTTLYYPIIPMHTAYILYLVDNNVSK